jgi:hypothetical protein
MYLSMMRGRFNNKARSQGRARFGVLISAALRTSLSSTPLRRLFSGSSVRDQLAALNPVALAVSFILFPLRIAGARVATALTMALLGSAVVAKITRDSALATTPEKGAPQRSPRRRTLSCTSRRELYR